MKSWPKVKLGQIRVSSNMAQNHSSSPKEVLSGHHLPQSHEMFSWPIVKLCQVDVSSNIAQTHLCNLYEIISGHNLPQIIWKVDQKWNEVKLESVPTLLQITHLAPKKSYMVIITSIHMKCWSKSKLGQVENASNISHNHSFNPSEVISGHYLTQSIHRKSWPKEKLCEVGVGLNIA